MWRSAEQILSKQKLATNVLLQMRQLPRTKLDKQIDQPNRDCAPEGVGRGCLNAHSALQPR